MFKFQRIGILTCQKSAVGQMIKNSQTLFGDVMNGRYCDITIRT